MQVLIAGGDGGQLMSMTHAHHEAADLGQGRDEAKGFIQWCHMGAPAIQSRQGLVEGLKLLGALLWGHQQ